VSRHAGFVGFPYADQRLCGLCNAVPFATGMLQRRFMAGIRSSRRVGPAHQIWQAMTDEADHE
jgi:hypothetical protein